MTPADAVALIRTRNGLSVVAFAARLGVDDATVQRVEAGEFAVSDRLDAAVRRVFWFSPRVLADPAGCGDPEAAAFHLTYLRPLGAMP